MFKGKVHAKKLVSRRTETKPSHQSVGDQSSSRGVVSSTTRRHCETPHRFPNSSLLHQEARRNQKFILKPRGLSALERSSVKKSDSPDPTLAVNSRQCDGRFPVKTPNKSVGISVIQRCLPSGSGSFSSESYSGRVCLEGNKDVAKVHDLVPGPGGSRQGRTVASMGPGVICFSSSSTHPEVSPEAREGEDHIGDDLATVADHTVVAPGTESIDRPHPTPTILPDNPDHGGQIPGPAIPPASGGSSFGKKNLNYTSDPDLDKFLANHLAVGTQKGYNSSFSKFDSYCSSRNLNPTNCNPQDIARYLMFLYESGSSYSSVNLARSAISKFHVGFNGIPAGQNQIVCNAVKATFKLRPPLPKYTVTFDVSVVLDYIKKLPTNPQLSLKMLTYKTLFLLTVASISRVSSIAKLGPNLSVFKVTTLFIN